MKTTHQDRLARYVVMAAVPAAASAGYAVADYLHYGGPAIEITRSLQHSSTYNGFDRSWFAGSRSAYSGQTHSEAPDAPIVGVNMGFHSQATSHNRSWSGSSNSQKAKFELFNNTVSSSFAMAVSGTHEGLDLVARFSASNMISQNMSNDFASGPMVLAKSVSSSWASDGHHTYTDWSVGAWALDGHEEQRGYLGFSGLIEGELGFGWMDIGWDGDTLTIYDWAFNTDGAIHVPDTHVVPGGAGLAALAMGAAGMRRRRKRSA